MSNMKSIKLTNIEIELILQSLQDLANHNLETAMWVLNDYGKCKEDDAFYYDKSDSIHKIAELRGMFKQMLRD